jgi:hypothetical protein
MKLPRGVFFLVLLVLALLLWREVRVGVLQSAEDSLTMWVAESARPDLAAPPGPTLVFQGGVTGAELSSLDIGLFVRAATRLGARVVAVAAYEFDVTQLNLEVRPSETTRYVAGSLLLPRSAGGGLSPGFLAGVDPVGWKGEDFAGSYSTFPAERGWQSGFLNLPSGGGSRNAVPILAKWRGELVPSFALAVYNAFLTGGTLAEIEGSLANGLRLCSWILPVDPDGLIPLQSSALRQLRRVDMDDLLLEVERVEQGRPANTAITDLIAGRMVILGTLLPEGGSTIRLGEGRQLSLAEFQGLAVASLQAALRFPPLPLWVDAICLLLSLLWAGVLRGASLDRAVALFVAGVAGWFLLAFVMVQQFAQVPPLLLPNLVFLAALILRICFHQKPTLPPEAAAALASKEKSSTHDQ